jgi:hypothetical protein
VFRCHLISSTAGDDFLDDNLHYIIPSGSRLTLPLDADIHIVLGNFGSSRFLERSGSATSHHLPINVALRESATFTTCKTIAGSAQDIITLMFHPQDSTTHSFQHVNTTAHSFQHVNTTAKEKVSLKDVGGVVCVYCVCVVCVYIHIYIEISHPKKTIVLPSTLHPNILH